MSTTIYNEYYEKIQSKEIDIENVFFNVSIVTENYVPNVNDKPIDVFEYIITNVGALSKKDIVTLSMSEILDKVKQKLKKGIAVSSNSIISEIDKSNLSDEKKENLKNLMMNVGMDNDYDFWNKLSENGLTYLLFESKIHNTLCFCEEIKY